MKKIAALLVAGSMTAIAVPAAAQDSGTFTGPRVEALAGYDISRAGSSVDNDTNENDDQSIDGLVYGAGVGYDFNAGGVVLGVEASITDSTAKVETTGGDTELFGIGNVETGRDLYVGARVGVLASPDLLAYAKGGYTSARYHATGSFDGEDYRRRVSADGFRLGAGLEYALSGNTFAKLEYNYSNYGDAEVQFENGSPDVDFGSIDVDRHQIMAGVGFRF